MTRGRGTGGERDTLRERERYIKREKKWRREGEIYIEPASQIDREIDNQGDRAIDKQIRTESQAKRDIELGGEAGGDSRCVKSQAGRGVAAVSCLPLCGVSCRYLFRVCRTTSETLLGVVECPPRLFAYIACRAYCCSLPTVAWSCRLEQQREKNRDTQAGRRTRAFHPSLSRTPAPSQYRRGLCPQSEVGAIKLFATPGTTHAVRHPPPSLPSLIRLPRPSAANSPPPPPPSVSSPPHSFSSSPLLPRVWRLFCFARICVRSPVRIRIRIGIRIGIGTRVGSAARCRRLERARASSTAPCWI